MVYFYVCGVYLDKRTEGDNVVTVECSSVWVLHCEQAASQVDGTETPVEVQPATPEPEGEQDESRAGGDAPGQVGESEEPAEQSAPQSSQLMLTVPGQDGSLKVN